MPEPEQDDLQMPDNCCTCGKAIGTDDYAVCQISSSGNKVLIYCCDACDPNPTEYQKTHPQGPGKSHSSRWR